MERQRRDRFSYAQRIGADGKVFVIEERDLTDWDDQLFAALAPYDYLTADDLAGITGRNADAITNRFGDLKLHPHRWIDIAEPMMARSKSYRNDPLAYSLSANSKKRVARLGLGTPYYGFSGPFIHKLMAQHMRASFDIAVYAEKVNAAIIPHHQILAEFAPAETRDEKGDHKHQMQIEIESGGKWVKRWITPDAYPFAIRNPKGDALIFLEADRNTEDVISADGNSLDTKFRQYLTLFDEKVFKTRYGFDMAYAVFGFTSPQHMENGREHLSKLTVNHKHYRKRFLFTFCPDLDSDYRPSPTGHMVTNPYRRAGLPDFSLLTGEEVPNGYREIRGADRTSKRDRPGNRRAGQRRQEGEQAARL